MSYLFFLALLHKTTFYWTVLPTNAFRVWFTKDPHRHLLFWSLCGTNQNTGGSDLDPSFHDGTTHERWSDMLNTSDHLHQHSQPNGPTITSICETFFVFFVQAVISWSVLLSALRFTALCGFNRLNSGRYEQALHVLSQLLTSSQTVSKVQFYE